MTDFRATPEQWALLEEQSAPEYDSTILELRTRVEALEANTKYWRIDHLRLANTCASLAPDRLKFFNALLPDAEDSQPTPNPIQIRSWLVDRVARAIGRDDEPINWEPEARAAIREVLAWLKEGEHTWAALKLEQEVEQ
jgi:hypothetical protein